MKGILTLSSRGRNRTFVLCAGILGLLVATLAPSRLPPAQAAQTPFSGRSALRVPLGWLPVAVEAPAESGALASATFLAQQGGTEEQQLCATGARWLRVRFTELVLDGKDTLTLTGSEGGSFRFAGNLWEGRTFASRALVGECIRLSAEFSSDKSRYLIESYEYGTTALELATVVVASAGDICDSGGVCSQTADVLDTINPAAVVLAGDNVYDSGTLSEYNNLYHPYWGRFKSITHPTPGNHEYQSSGAAGYFDYFNGPGQANGPAGERGKGYYSRDIGDWHFVALNSNISMSAGSAQEQWLRTDLAANTKPCTAAVWHHPRFSHGNYSDSTASQPLWQALYERKADLVLVGHDHNYQRYKPLTPTGTIDTANGIRQFLVGTGGRSFYPLGSPRPTIDAENDDTHGVLKLTLTATGYSFAFVPVSGASFTDSGSATCHNATTATDFSLAASPSTLSAVRGGSASSTVTIASLSGFASAVSLDCAGLPAGVTCGYSPSSVTPPANGTVNSGLTVSVASSTAAGSYSFQARGTSGATVRAATISLTVTSAPAPDFSVSCSPSSLSAAQGGSAASTCTVSSTNGFSSAVSLDCAGLPSLAETVALGELPTEVWITLGRKEAEQIKASLARRGQADLLQVESDAEVVVARIREDSVPELARVIHEDLHRCGGFVAHESRERAFEAVAHELARLPSEALVEYTIDNGAVVNAMLPNIQETNVRSFIISLAAYFTRYHTSQTGQDSANWIRSQWQTYAQGRPDVTVELYAHPASTTPQRSVILTIPGSTLPNEVVVLGAHQDSINGATGRAPGADDDASGIASLSEVIRVALSMNYRPQRTVKFMAYAAEEVGLRGSNHIATQYKNTNVNVVGVLQLDMTNYKGTPSADIVLITDFTNAAQNTFLGQLVDTYLGLPRTTTQCGYACSDHASWNTQGYAASFPVEATFDDSNPTIHTANDTLAQSGNNANHAVKFSKLAAAYVAELAKGGFGGGANLPPVANAGPDQNVTVGNVVTLNGSASSDPDNGPSPLSYAWSQVSGPSVTLSNPNAAQPSFTSTTAAAYLFQLTVSDGSASSSDQVQVTATGGGNLPPAANAGPDQNVTVGNVVTLNGSASSDPDNGPSPLSYAWSQVSGPSVTLSNPNAAQPSFTPTTAAAHVFQLTVSDGSASSSDQVQVTATGGGGGGVTCGYSPSSVTPPANGSANSALTVSVAGGVAAGTYSLQARGTNGATQRTANISLTVTSPTVPAFSVSCSPSSLSAAQGGSAASTCTVSSTNGFSGAVALACSGVPSGASCGFVPASVTPPANGSASSALTVSVASSTGTGTYAFNVNGTNGAATRSASMSLTVTGTGPGPGPGDLTASFDTALQAPKCATVGRSCDTGPSLVLGRAALGPEPNQPNTIADSCADGSSGTFHSDESSDRIKVSTTDGTAFAAGKTVRIDATVWAYSSPSDDALDLFYAANASSPTWTFIGTLVPTVAGAQTLSATYTLPAGAVQAVRAQFRYQGTNAACSAGEYTDRDDLAFAVTSTSGGTVFSDTFETGVGWTTNPNGTDTATIGAWERGDPEATTSTGPKQLGTTTSGVNDLVTDRLAGVRAGANDVDGGTTSIQSPTIVLPATGTLTLSFQYYLAHLTNSSTDDFFRASVVVGTTTTQVFQSLGAAANRDGAWTPVSVSLNAFAGQTVRIRFEASDASTASLVEAGVDDVTVTQQ